MRSLVWPMNQKETTETNKTKFPGNTTIKQSKIRLWSKNQRNNSTTNNQLSTTNGPKNLEKEGEKEENEQ